MKCVTCPGRVESGVDCDACKAEKRRLADLHERFRRDAPEADRSGRELRVSLYAAVVAMGGVLFEGVPH